MTAILLVLPILAVLPRARAMEGADSTNPAGATVDRSSGTATWSIPIEILPGPGGHEPSLGLVYSSEGGDGPVGLGWSASWGRITCAMREGVPEEGPCSRHELDGELLMPPASPSDHHHTLSESFSRIRLLEDDSWEVTTTDGTRLLYGASLNSRLHVDGDPSRPIAVWLLAESRDVFGNAVSYRYRHLATDPGMAYPLEVTYAEGVRRIEYAWEARPDPSETFAGGLHRAMTQRLREVRVFSQPGVLHHRLELRYSEAGAYAVHRSRLVSVQRFGSDCPDLSSPPSAQVGCSSLPAQVFTYTDSADELAETIGSQFEIDGEWTFPWGSDADNLVARSLMSGLPWGERGHVLNAVSPALTVMGGRIRGGASGAGATAALLTTTSVDWSVQPRVVEPGEPAPMVIPGWPDSKGVRWGDVDGDGLIDVIRADCGFVEHPALSPDECVHGVHLNHGSGWETTPDPDWTAALASLRWEAPSLTLSQNPTQRLYADSSPYCVVEPGSLTSPVFFQDVEFPISRKPIASHEELGWWTNTFEGVSDFRVVDLDGDGRSDLIASVRVGGAWLQYALSNGCTDPLPAPIYREATARVVFLNTGEGWERQASLENPALPIFSALEIRDHTPYAPFDVCGTNGWGGSWGLLVEDRARSRGYCRSSVDFSPEFVELNGDGRLDVLVLAPRDPRYVIQEHSRFPFDDSGVEMPPCPVEPEVDEDLRGAFGLGLACHNPSRTLAFVQTRNEEGEFEWRAAPEFALDAADAGGPIHHRFVAFSHQADQDGIHPGFFRGGFKYGDVGVRFVDLNADGLTDVVWRDPFLDPIDSEFDAEQFPATFPTVFDFEHPNGPRHAAGVLLNTGRGWCASTDPSGCPTASRYLPPAPIAIAPSVGEAFEFYVAGVLQSFSSGLGFVDLNGDGLVDLARGGESPEEWLQSPGASGSAWIRDPASRFRPPSARILPMDVDGDGVVDWMGASLFPSAIPFYLARSVSSLPDLLKRIDNGRGGTIDVVYEVDVRQRDALLETAAVGVAEELSLPGGSDVRNLTRWLGKALVRRVEVRGPNLLRDADPDPQTVLPEPVVAATDYRYARPRWCPEHRTDMGFALVEETAPDGSRTDSFFHQSHGVAGGLARRIRWSDGAPLSFEETTWERVEDIPGLGSDSHLGRIRSRRSRNEYGAEVGATTGAEELVFFSYDDDYGFNFIAETRRVRPSSSLTTTATPFPRSMTDWVIGLVAEESSRDDASLLSRSVLDYLTTSTGRATTRVASRSDLVRERKSAEAGEWRMTRFSYDDHGNLIERIVDPGGLHLVRSFCFDGMPGCLPGHRSKSIPVEITDEIGHVTKHFLDPVWSKPRLVQSAYRDEPMRWTVHDAFGRLQRQGVTPFGSMPGGESDRLLLEITREDFASPPVVRSTVYFDDEATSSATSIEIGDGFGGTWRAVEQGAAESSGFVGTARAVDPARRRIFQSRRMPCGADDTCSELSGLEARGFRLDHDPLGRPVRSTAPDGSFSTVRHGATVWTAPVPPGFASGSALERVRIKSARGAVLERLEDGDRVVRSSVCANELEPLLEEPPPCLEPEHVYSAYDGFGDLTHLFDAVASGSVGADLPTEGPHVNLFERDTLGRVVRAVDPNGGPRRAVYDLASRPIALVNARGETRLHAWDPLGRLLSVETPEDEPDVVLEYVADQRQVASESSLPDGYRLVFRYDELGRLRQRSEGLLGGFATRYSRDLVGRIEEIAYPVSDAGVRLRTRYEYEGAYLRRVCDPGEEQTCASPRQAYLEDVLYDDLGRAKRIVMPGGERTFELDPITGRLERERFESGPGGTYWLERLHANPVDGEPFYDGEGNRTEILVRDSIGDLPLSQRFTYDRKGRIDSWEYDGVSYEYEYDLLGNLITHAGRVQLYDDPERPHAIRSGEDGGAVYTYDADGNVSTITKAGSTRFFDWDSANRLHCEGTSRAACDVLEVFYDVSGQRVKEIGSRRRRFVGQDFAYAEDGPVSDRESRIEIFAFGRRVASRTLRGGSLALVPPPILPPGLGGLGVAVGLGLLTGCVAWLVGSGTLDRLLRMPGHAATTALIGLGLAMWPRDLQAGGAPRAVGFDEVGWILSGGAGTESVIVDSRGDRLTHVVREPFGKLKARVGAEARGFFGGHPRQEDTRLYSMQARWMDPDTGRFLSVDPILRSASWSESHNGYSYAENNPVTFQDPTGMSIWDGVESFRPVMGQSPGSRAPGMDLLGAGGGGTGPVGFGVMIVGLGAPQLFVGRGRTLRQARRRARRAASKRHGNLGRIVGSGFLSTGLASDDGSADDPLGTEDPGSILERVGAKLDGGTLGRALVKLSNERINARLDRRIVALRAQARAGDFDGLDVAGFKVRTIARAPSLGVDRILSGAVLVVSQLPGTPGFPHEFAPRAFLSPPGTTTTVSLPILIHRSGPLPFLRHDLLFSGR